MANSATLTNAGVVTGNITTAPASGTGSSTTGDSSAGTINGNLSSGSGNDILIARQAGTPVSVTGISGTIDGGGGTDVVQLQAQRDLTIKTAVNLPARLRRLRRTPGTGATVTLSNGFVAPGTIELTAKPPSSTPPP